MNLVRITRYQNIKEPEEPRIACEETRTSVVASLSLILFDPIRLPERAGRAGDFTLAFPTYCLLPDLYSTDQGFEP